MASFSLHQSLCQHTHTHTIIINIIIIIIIIIYVNAECSSLCGQRRTVNAFCKAFNFCTHTQYTQHIHTLVHIRVHINAKRCRVLGLSSGWAVPRLPQMQNLATQLRLSQPQSWSRGSSSRRWSVYLRFFFMFSPSAFCLLPSLPFSFTLARLFTPMSKKREKKTE